MNDMTSLFYNGLPIRVVDEKLLTVEKLVQVKFSKRKNWRIVKRWRKNPKNFAKRKQLMSMIVDHQGQKVLFVDKTTFEKIQSLS